MRPEDFTRLDSAFRNRMCHVPAGFFVLIQVTENTKDRGFLAQIKLLCAARRA